MGGLQLASNFILCAKNWAMGACLESNVLGLQRDTEIEDLLWDDVAHVGLKF